MSNEKHPALSPAIGASRSIQPAPHTNQRFPKDVSEGRPGSNKISGRSTKKTSGKKRKTATFPAIASGGRPGSNKISAPAHLRPDTASWWASVAGDYALEPHHLRILTLAAEAWDRGVEAREAIAKHGTVYVDRFAQPRARPEIAIERDSRIAFARLVRELALDVDTPDEPGRPPRIAGSSGRRDAASELDDEDRRIFGFD